MPLEELVYWRLDVPDNRVIPAFADRFEGSVYSPSTPPSLTRINIALLLYACAERLEATTLEGSTGIHEFGKPGHLRAFLDHHTGEGWGDDDSTLPWQIDGIGEPVVHLRKRDGQHDSDQDVEGFDENGPYYRKGLVFLRNTNDNARTSARFYRAFMCRFRPVLTSLCEEHHIPQRARLIQPEQ